MGGRYYCDYCDKSFVNTPGSVKKHVKGLQHQSLRNEHYKLFEDKRSILEKELKKIPCKKMMENGQCLFGASCRFSHYTRYQLDLLKYECEENERIERIRQQQNINYNPNIETWLSSRNQRGLSNSAYLDRVLIEKMHSNCDITNIMPWNYPPILNNIPQLPPSLNKINLEHFKDFKLTEWG